ncbi:hypothetical protein RRG08_032299 [Elysia crispata]|uniref:Uncharacterized protein n=1 Tax=Elysia crispata TaxID=231223 RepID=A0AAE1E3I0_9GAST|nr:hypothetical protein RRG08_032299 [Elysia crispata]
MTAANDGSYLCFNPSRRPGYGNLFMPQLQQRKRTLEAFCASITAENHKTISHCAKTTAEDQNSGRCLCYNHSKRSGHWKVFVPEPQQKNRTTGISLYQNSSRIPGHGKLFASKS